MKTARINEIFSSIQGEGPYHGIPQVFIRFSGCNLKCGYCDTDHLDYKEYTLEELLLASRSELVHSISITGGEPLCQVDFLKNFLPRVSHKIYLETNGILCRELELLLPYIDIISMDIKLSSSTGQRSFWNEHREFLKIGSAKEIFVKVVITKNTTLNDFETAVNLIHETDPDILLVLQPVMPIGPPRAELQEFRKSALEKLSRVEIIPQIHKLLGIK